MRRIYKYYLLPLLFVATQTVLANEKLVIVRPAKNDFKVVADTLKEELSSTYTIESIVFASNPSFAEFSTKLAKSKGSLFVLLDNSSIEHFKKWNEGHGYKHAGIGGMGLNLFKMLGESQNMAGVAYEVPAFSIVTNFNKVSHKKVKKVSVIYRKSQFQGIIDDAKMQLKRENIELLAVAADEANIEKSVNQYFKDIKAKKLNPDLVWVLLDNILLSQKIFVKEWIANSRKISVPLACGSDFLVSKKIKLCSFASFPNIKEMAVQIAEIAHAFAEGESLEDIGVEYIESVSSIINPNIFMQKKVGLKGSSLGNIKFAK